MDIDMRTLLGLIEDRVGDVVRLHNGLLETYYPVK